MRKHRDGEWPEACASLVMETSNLGLQKCLSPHGPFNHLAGVGMISTKRFVGRRSWNRLSCLIVDQTRSISGFRLQQTRFA
jgi:hypothetical protein